ncbi:DUF58 domain-containing protein [Humisphaera borealis]|uniref:DUF58 domain-containing protein n=1 Tax=Humisphaera borealis TaxID=2807512 RepID=A0A7M2X0M3_9BACT|nr:DUF58 domain-containing protein [Humisphaera borealis]QOV91204.1 DUF58 domain-containing protein [Humisphaera borealis]
MRLPFTAKPAYAPPPIRRRPSLDFSLVGLVYCCMMMFMGLAAINSGANLLYGVFGLMIGVLILAAILSKRVLRKLTVHRVLPDHAIVGVPSRIVYQFANAKRFYPSLSVTVSEIDAADGFTKQPQAYMLHAAAGMTASVPTEVIPRRRGLHQLDRFQISTSFPFGFIKRALTDRQKDHLLVYPTIGSVDRAVLNMCRAADKTGAMMRPRQGGQDEFYGVKEHRPGESPRHIYWKRSARTAATGVLVAREMTQVAPPRLLLLVDTWVSDQSAPKVAGVERSVAMAATLADCAIEQDLSVGMLAWSDGWKYLEPSRGKRHRGDLLSALARLPLQTIASTSQLMDEGLRYIRDGATAVLLTPQALPAGIDTRQRGAVVVLPSDDPQIRRWFTFEARVDFMTCSPAVESKVK